jgi:hypothetical protein
MKRERILWTLVLFAVLGAFLGVYQFYFKQKLANYAKDAIALKNAKAAYTQLKTTFEGYNPDDVIGAWRGVVQPWKESVLDRGKYFNDGKWFEHTAPSDDVPILRFWYDEQMRKEFTKLYTEFSQTQGLTQAPPYEQIVKQFGVATLQDLELRSDITARDINRELGRIACGMNVCRMLMKAKANYIIGVWLWPGRELKENDGLLRMWTLGLDFGMPMKDFVNFIDNNLRTADRYFNIEGLKIDYPYVGYNVEPVLHVQMLLTYATFVEGKSGTGENAEIGAPVGANPNDIINNNRLRNAPEPEEPVTGWYAWWLWFKRDILFLRG